MWRNFLKKIRPTKLAAIKPRQPLIIPAGIWALVTIFIKT